MGTKRIIDYENVTPTGSDKLLINQNGTTCATTIDEVLKETTTQLNANEQNINNHKAKLVTSEDGVHGLKIESSTFNPVVFGASDGNPDVKNTVAKYTKIDKVVFFTIYFEFNNAGSSTGELTISGLPYRSLMNTPINFLGTCINLTDDNKSITAETQNNLIKLYKNNPFAIIDGSEIVSDSWLHLSGSYIISEE